MKLIENKKVKDLMTYGVISIPSDSTIVELINVFAVGNVHGVIVRENDIPVGFVSDIDITKAFGKDLNEVKVKEIMSSPLLKINMNEKVGDATKIMKMKNCHRLAVVNDKGDIIGVFSITDIIREIYKMYKECK